MRRRERDAKRVAKSVREHKETMDAFGRAAVKEPNVLRGHIASSTDKSGKTTYHIDSNPSTY